MTYILVDTANMFFRARHVVRGDSIETKIGMAYHIMFSSILKAYRDFNGSHVVFCLEGRSWRKDYYEPYKANRKVARDALTPANGMVIYNTTDNKFQGYENGAWANLI